MTDRVSIHTHHPRPTALAPANDGNPAGRTLAQTPLKKYFEAAVQHGASDLLLRGGQPPRLRLDNQLKPLDTPPLDPQAFERHVAESLSETQQQRYRQWGALDIGVDFVFHGDQPHRFRVNVFRTCGRTAIAARYVNNTILDFDSLHLPPVMSRIVQAQQGLVLVAGVTDSGKSTTVASMIQAINQTRACHIITIEDPIEYLFTDAKALINQREVGIDVPSFPAGLRDLVRENPDVVLIGEMRDRETFEAALQAAETGHLVFGTLHASGVAHAFSRIYDLFTPEERRAVRNMLAYQLEAIFYQKLLPASDTQARLLRIPAVEALLHTPATRKYILDARENELDQVIKNERDTGMQSFADSLIQLVEKQYIHYKTAMAAATNPMEIKMKLKGISAG